MISMVADRQDSRHADGHCLLWARRGVARKHRSGFTLPELLITMAVLAAVAAMTLPAMRGPLDKSRLRSAARDVQAALARARASAIRDGREVQFVYQSGGTTFRLEQIQQNPELSDRITLVDDAGSAGMTASGLRAETGDGGVALNAMEGQTQAGPFSASSDSGHPSFGGLTSNGLSSAENSESRIGRVLLREGVLPTGVRFASASSAGVLSSSVSSGTPDLFGLAMPPASVASDPAGIGSGNQPLSGEMPGAGSVADLSAPAVMIRFLPDGRTRETMIRLTGSRDFVIDVRVRGLTGTASFSAPVRVSAGGLE